MLETFADIPRSGALVGRIDKLASRPPDPRIALKLALLAEDWPILGDSAYQSLSRALALIVRIADHRTLAVLGKIVVSRDGSPRRGFLQAGFTAYVEQLRAAAPYREGPNVEALMAWLAADAAARRGPVTDDVALFAAVYANPTDDGPRLVLADFLQQRGDPRGEFIALQLAPPHGPGAKVRRAREQELVKTYGREWLGPLEPAISKHGVTFARGFLSKCIVREPGRSALARILDAVEWATVEELDATSWQEPAIRSAQLMPVLRWLRDVKNVPSHPHLQHVQIEVLESLAQLANVVAPKLHSITINSVTCEPVAFAPFWRTPVGRQLEYFAIDTPDFEPWFTDLWSRVSPRGPLQRATLSTQRFSQWRFWIEADGALRCELLWAFTAPAANSFDELAERLDALDKSMFSKIRLAFRDELSPRLAAAIRRFDR